MYELIITEKPNASKRIADALADGKAIKENLNGVPYYKVTHGNKDIVVACAVGHLYGLAEKGKKTWDFPVFDIEWKPAADINKKSAFSKKYLTVIKKLAKEANELSPQEKLQSIFHPSFSTHREIYGDRGQGLTAVKS